MSTAESIFNILGGKREGKGFRVPAVCHGSSDKNLILTDSESGKLLAHCMTKGCSYSHIMQTLESMGLKEKRVLSANEKKIVIARKTRLEAMKVLQIEIHIALQCLQAGEFDQRGKVAVNRILSNLQDAYPEARQVQPMKLSAGEIESSMFDLLNAITDRLADMEKRNDKNYLKLHPEFVPFPLEPFEREVLAAEYIRAGVFYI